MIMKKIFMIGFLFIASVVSAANEGFETKLLYSELEATNPGKHTLIIDGKVYKYKEDRKKTLYRSEYDKGKSLTLRSLHKGKKYYFSLYKSISEKSFNTIIFIASEKPAE